MSIRVLEKKSVENTGFDGAIINFIAANHEKNGIIPIGSQCATSIINSNTLAISSGQFLVGGFRIALDGTENITVNVTSSTVGSTYYLFAQIAMSGEDDISFNFIQSATNNLVQDDVLGTRTGTYQVLFATMTLDNNGLVSVTRNISTINPIVSQIFKHSILWQAGEFPTAFNNGRCNIYIELYDTNRTPYALAEVQNMLSTSANSLMYRGYREYYKDALSMSYSGIYLIAVESGVLKVCQDDGSTIDFLLSDQVLLDTVTPIV